MLQCLKRIGVSFKAAVVTASLLALLAVASPTFAQTTYSAPTVSVESLFSFGDLAITMLTIVGTAFGAVAGFYLAVAVGKKVVGWLRRV